MSRIGKLPISIPAKVKVEVHGQEVKATGPLGTLSYTLPQNISAAIDGDKINVAMAGNDPVVNMVLAIEPMLNAGTYDVYVQKNGWTVVTADGKMSAHFEHTVAVTEQGPEIMTAL